MYGADGNFVSRPRLAELCLCMDYASLNFITLECGRVG